MLLSYGFGSIDAVAHLDGIEVDLHDAFLAPDEFDEHGEVGFQPLAHPAWLRPEEHILGRLLTDSAAAAVAFARATFLQSLVYLDEVESVVREEPLVFAGHHSHGQVDAHRIERYPMMLEAQCVAVVHLLGTADYHQGGDIDGTPLVDDDGED